MRKKVLPLVLTFALALSPVSEAFASAELSPDPVSSESAESMPEEISQDEAVTQILEKSYTETAENTETETPELVPEAETEDEFSSESFIFRKSGEGEAALTGLTGAGSELTVPKEVAFDEETLLVTSIEEGALSGEGIEKISLPAAIRDFGAQELPSLAAVETAEDSEVYTAVDGVLFKKDEEGKSTLVLYPSAKEGKDYVIPEATAAVSEHAFSKTANLDTIVIGSDLEKIEAGAFSNMKENARIAFLREDAEIDLEKGAFTFAENAGSVLYFVNVDVLGGILEKSPEFAVVERPAESEEAAAEESLAESAEESLAESADESLAESAEESLVGAAEESLVGAAEESLAESAEESPAESADESPAESAAETAEESDSETPAFTFNTDGIPEDILALIETEEVEVAETAELVAAGTDAKIARGYYEITNGFRKNRVMSTRDGVVKTADASSPAGSVYEIIPVGNEKYALVSFETGNAATLQKTPPANYVFIVDSVYTGADTQKWYIRTLDAEAGTVEIIPALDDTMRLEIKNALSAVGTPLMLYKSNGSGAQSWTIKAAEAAAVSLEDGLYTVSAYKDKNIVVEAAGGSIASTANIQLGKNTNARYQQFKITSLGYGNYYKLENLRSHMVWDVEGGKKTSGSNIQQYAWNGTGAQIFKVIETEENGEKVYQFIGKASGLAVDYSGAVAKAGTNVRLYTPNGTAGQKWYLTKQQDETVPGTDAKVGSGYYKIYSSLSTALSVGIAVPRSSDGMSAVMCPAEKMDGTIFQIVPTSGGRYKIIVAETGKLLTFTGDYAENYTDIIQRSATGKSNQEWYIRKKSPSDTNYIFVSADNPRVVMDLSGALARNGRNVRFYTNNGTPAQEWRLEKASNPNTHVLPNGVYSIANMNKTSMVMAVSGASTSSGGNIVISSRTGTAPNQLFKIEACGSSGNEYKITNLWSGCALDVAGGSRSNSANVQQYTWNGSTAQRFRIVQVNGGSNPTYKIIGVGSGNAVDVSSGRTNEGANVQMYSYNGSGAQLWQFNKVSSVNTVVTGTFINFVSKVNSDYKLGWRVNSTGLTAQKDKKSVAQAFRIETVSGGYRIYNPGSGKYMTANGSTGVTFTDWKDDAAHKWKFQGTGDDDYSFYIVSAANGKYLTSLSSLTDGSGVWLADGSTAKNKKFVVKAATIQSGWVEINGQWRYYKSDGTFPVDTFYENGKYYFNSQGYAGTGWARYGGFYYYYKGKDGREMSDARPYLSALFGTKTSWNGYNCPKCSYHLSVDTAYPCQITVYTTYPGTSGWNLPVMSFLCSPGTTQSNGMSSTIYGDRRVGDKSRWQELMGPSYGQYATVIETYTYVAGSNNQIIDWTNTGQYIHSVACGQPNEENLDPGTYNLLGTRQSHGCVRVPVRYAYWIYSFTERNQGIGVGENLVRPLNTLKLPRAVTAVDPTDPKYTGNWGYLDNQNYQFWHGQYIN